MTDQEYTDLIQELRNLHPKDLLFRLLFGECRGERIEAQVGVGCVVRNRVSARRETPTPETWSDVILAPYQFSCFLPSDPNLPKLLNPEGSELLQVLQQLKWVAQGIVDGSLLDNVARATHYYDFSVIVGRGQQKDDSRLGRYLEAVDKLLAPGRVLSVDLALARLHSQEWQAAHDLIHTLVAPLPPKWDDEVLPCARKGRLVFFKL
jgi:hypothetical protein